MFHTTFTAANSHTSINWMTCDQDSTSSGCFGSGGLGPFTRACSLAGNGEGHVFVMDATGGDNISALLYIYNQSETSTPRINLWNTVALPKIIGTDDATCFVSVVGHYVYLGTTTSTIFAKVNWKTLDLNAFSVCSPARFTSSITATKDFVTISQSGCFIGYNKDGVMMIDGGEVSTTFAAGNNGYAIK